MVTTPDPKHLDHHHRDTLARIFGHPVGHNIEWRAVLSLLEAIGAVERSHDGKFVVALGSEVETFDEPAGKDLDVQQVMDLRRMLTGAGYVPDASAAE